MASCTAIHHDFIFIIKKMKLTNFFFNKIVKIKKQQ